MENSRGDMVMLLSEETMYSTSALRRGKREANAKLSFSCNILFSL